MKHFSIIFSLCLFATTSFAQEIFITKGRIEFEKKINIHKQIELTGDEDNTWINGLKKSLPQHKSLFFNLYFDADKTLYKPGKDDQGQKVPDWILGPGNENVVYNDLATGQTLSQKAVFENTYLFQDSLRKINWKITNDTRTIAGFECRKATGIIMDSIYVFAFYTDQIMVSGGPESFTGLPGMILGIAIPRISTTWFATKLELVEVKPTDLAAPKKGKKATSKDLALQLKDLMKNWGKWGQRNMWSIFL
jgi:GLPGLI family protein